MSHQQMSHEKRFYNGCATTAYLSAKILWYGAIVTPVILFASIFGVYGFYLGGNNLLTGNIFPYILTTPLVMLLSFIFIINFSYWAYGKPTKVVDTLGPRNKEDEDKLGIDLNNT